MRRFLAAMALWCLAGIATAGPIGPGFDVSTPLAYPPDPYPATSWYGTADTFESCPGYDGGAGVQCSLIVTFGGADFVFGGLDAVTTNFDACISIRNSNYPPTSSAIALSFVGSGSGAGFSFSTDVLSCDGFARIGTGYAGTPIDTLTITTRNDNWISINNIEVAAVPEPQTWALFAVGLLMTALTVRRRSSVSHRRHRAPSANVVPDLSPD